MWNATALCHVTTIISTENTYLFKLPEEIPAEQVKRQRRVVRIGKQKQQYPEYLVLNTVGLQHQHDPSCPCCHTTGRLEVKPCTEKVTVVCL